MRVENQKQAALPPPPPAMCVCAEARRATSPAGGVRAESRLERGSPMRSSCPPSLDVPTSVWVALVMLHPTPTNLASTTGSAQPSSQAMCTLQLHCNSTHAVGHPDRQRRWAEERVGGPPHALSSCWAHNRAAPCYGGGQAVAICWRV